MPSLYQIRNVPELAPGQILRFARRLESWVIAALRRDTPTEASVVLVDLATGRSVMLVQIFDTDLDSGRVEVLDGERVLAIFDGMPALGASDDGREISGAVAWDGGILAWRSRDGRYSGRLCTLPDGRWYAPALDLVILLGEVAS